MDKEAYRQVIITSAREEVPGVKTFTLTYDDGEEIPYAAGQFITFVFHRHGREERRSFSISSAPGQRLAFTVKRVDNGAYSRLLVDRAIVGDKLSTTGAAGLFTLTREYETSEQVFFFAAGIGITPIISLIKTILHTDAATRVVLVYSNRNRQETVFYDELIALSEQYADRFRIEFLYSSSFNLARARLSKALVPVLVDENRLADKSGLLFYICGPFAYMRMVTYALEEMGIADERIRKENFNTNDRQVIQAEPPDKGTHMVTILRKGHCHTFPVRYPDTILKAALSNGLQLPYSCEVGRCGSCAARCLSGKVWLSYNEVLMDMDLAHGAILTCTGHPIGGDVTIAV